MDNPTVDIPRSNLNWSIPGLNSVFLPLDWLLNQCKRTLSALTIGKERKDGFMIFQRALVWSELQTISSWIWPCINKSISYNDNRYAISTKIKKGVATVVKGNLKAPFSITTTPKYRGEHYSFSWIAPLPLIHTL